MTVHAALCTSEAALDRAFEIRNTVFVDEQGVPEQLEYDGNDETAIHVLGYHDDRAVGTARLRRPDRSTAKIERVAVCPAARQRGVGTALMRLCEAVAATLGCSTVLIHAQRQVAEFYRTLGYQQVGTPFEEASIPHIKMRKSLADGGPTVAHQDLDSVLYAKAVSRS